MALYDITIFLAGGATAKIKKPFKNQEAVLSYLEDQIKQDPFRADSETQTAVLIIKKPKDNIVGYLVDEV